MTGTAFTRLVPDGVPSAPQPLTHPARDPGLHQAAGVFLVGKGAPPAILGGAFGAYFESRLHGSRSGLPL
jgi:hypothetical protein